MRRPAAIHSLLASLLLLLFSGLHSPAADAESTEAQRVAKRVLEIFDAKCLECHSPEMPRPKGKFGYVNDLKRMADNPEYVVRGKPDDSDLYLMVLNDEMPGEDAPVPPLTPEEKEIVKRWVEMGAPHELPGGPPPGGDAVAVVEAPAAEAPSQPLAKQVLRWLGKFHPLSTHFPVALMMVAVLAEGIAWRTRNEQWMQTIRFLVIIAALGAVGATVLGWLNAHFSSYNKAPGELLWWHRWLGTATGVWAVMCAGASLAGRCEEGSPQRRRFRGALIVGAVLVGLSGFLGSALIYGLDHYSWP